VKASIIIVGYKGEKYLDDCLTSLSNLNFPKKDYEIIYVDNASPDKGIEIAEKYQKQLKNLKIIKSEKNLGFAEGNNLGIKQAQGKYIILFNQDAIADENFLLELIKAAELDKKIGAVGAKIYYLNSRDLYFAGGKILYGGFCWNWLLGDKEGKCDYVSGCAMLMRKDVLDKVGLLDKNLFCYYEETDLCTRIKKAGYKIYYSPKAIAWHNVAKKSKRASQHITYYMHRNRVIYCYKHYKHKNIFLLLDTLFFYNLFFIYEMLRVPGSSRFIKEVWQARKDSLNYCLNYCR